MSLCKKELRRLFDYRDGKLFWRVRLSHRAPVGREVAPKAVGRYKQVGINGVRYQFHRVVWAWHHDDPHGMEIDHVNQDTTDNRVENLRLVIGQARNKPKRRDNASGITGVSFDKGTDKWVARVVDNDGKYRNLGRFRTIRDATEARNKAVREFGYHPNHGEQHSKLQYRRV